MSNQCKICKMKFTEDRRLQIHMKTHRGKKKEKKSVIDFDAPRFDQVM